jgi:hypothetical protein
MDVHPGVGTVTNREFNMICMIQKVNLRSKESIKLQKGYERRSEWVKILYVHTTRFAGEKLDIKSIINYARTFYRYQ